MNAEKLQLAKEYIRSHREEMVQDLMTLCRVPSVRSAPQEGAPFGTEVLRALRAVKELHAREGMQGELSPAGSYLLTPYGEGDTTIGIFAHADVVPVQDGWMYTAPFDPVVKNDYVVARGAADNKNAIVESLYAVKALQAAGIALKSKLLLFTGGNEESGMQDVSDFIQENPMPTLSIVPDGGYPASRGEKGILRFDLSASCGEKILSLEAGEAYNVVPDLAKAVLAPDPDLWEAIKAKAAGRNDITLEKGECLTIFAHGISRHAAHPQDGVNAIFVLCEFLSGIAEFSPLDRSLAARLASLTKGYTGDLFGISAEEEVFYENTCVCGFAKTKEGVLTLGFDVRYGRAYTGEQLIERIKKHALEYAFPVSGINSQKDPFLIPAEDPILQTITGIYNNATGKNDLPYVMSGGTYSRMLKNSYTIGGCGPARSGEAIELPAGHGGAHQRDEVISITGLMQGAEILLEIICTLDEQV